MENDQSTLSEEEILSPCLAAAKYSTKATVSQTATFRSTEMSEKFTCISYTWELFESYDPPDNDGTFMATIGNELWAELEYLQKAACVSNLL